MPRDSRLFMTFPIDFDEHPKVAPLSDAAFRAFVEMNGYSRRHDLDGIIPEAVAVKRWGKKTLSELQASHQDRPLVYLSTNPDAYVIRDYAEHQETTASIQERRERNAANGRKGGRPRKNRTETDSVTDSVSGSGGDEKAESRVQSPEDLTKTSQSQSSPVRASVSTDAGASAMTVRLARQAGITSLQSVIDAVNKHTRRVIEADGAFQLAVHLAGKARAYPRNPQMYVTRSISLSPFEVQQFIDEHALAVTS